MHLIMSDAGIHQNQLFTFRSIEIWMALFSLLTDNFDNLSTFSQFPYINLKAPISP